MLLIKTDRPEAPRFHEKYVWDAVTDCMIWTSTHNRGGYGAFHLEGKDRRAHRVAYTWFVGPIGDGLVVDHLCERKSCVNPDHLEAVTTGENRRRTFARRLSFNCGHRRTVENCFYDSYNRGVRCRECSRSNGRRYDSARRQQVA